MKLIRFCAGAFAFSMALATANAGLQIPYTPDANTLHLWHFDDPFLNPDTTTNILATDAVVNVSITLTNLGQPNPGFPPYTNTSLGNLSFAGLGKAMQTTDKFGMCYGGLFNDVSEFSDTNTGAFTFEALVNLARNPFALPNNMEIVCGDTGAGIANRGWQFRFTTGGQMEFNLLGGSGSDNDFKAGLPNSGPDAAVAGQWYHMAVTCTGNAPTNGDTPYQLKFYWTLLDANRTSADLLATFTMTRALNGTTTSGAGTVQPAIAIGGSGRRITTGGNGVANGEGTIGLIDEVRISNIARGSNQMAFVVGGALNPPSFSFQPPTNTLVGYGKPLTLSSIVVGSLPISYQWQATNSSAGGWTNVLNQTNNTLSISNAVFADTGLYELVATNAYGNKTSTVAQLTVGAAFSELFDTGVDASGTTNILGGSTDLHYTLIDSADIVNIGPGTLVWNMGAYPIANQNGNFSNPDDLSQWIGPQANSYSSPVGNYTYRITFLLDSVDLTKPATLTGIWSVNEIGDDILLNGVSTGNSISSVAASAGKFSYPFTITSGFLPGLNTLDFVTTRSAGANGSYQESALRVEMSGVGLALAPGLPTILNTNLPINQTVRDAGATGQGDVANFSVVATGRPPLTYQWYADGAELTGATNRTLSFPNPAAGAQGTHFSVVISNDSGSVTSRVAVLTLVPTNQPPIAADLDLGTLTNAPLNIDVSTLLNASVDPDNDPLSFVSADTASTNGASVILNGATLTYTPNPNYVGHDEFHYVIQDILGAQSTGTIDITVSILTTPTIVSSGLSGNNLVFTGSGGAPLTGYHVFSSTDLSVPISSWTVAGTGQFDASGHFTFRAPILPGVPQSFYILQTP